MRGSPRGHWAAVAVLTLAATVTGCGSGGGAEGAKKNEITVEISEPQHGLVPTNTTETSGGEVLNQLFVGLVDYDQAAHNKPVERMAKSITSTDNRVWTIEIKKGYKFHNGEDVTAQSFADAWNYGANQDNAQEGQAFFSRFEGFGALAPGKGRKPTAKTLSGLQVIDPYTLKVTLTKPFNQFKTILGYSAFYPVPKKFLQDPKAFGEAPIGNGPFQMDGSWEHNKQVRLKRFDGFTEGPARIERVTFKIYDSLETAWNDLRAGNLDIMDQVPASALNSYKRELGARAIDQASSGVGYIGFPIATNPAFKNPLLRRAISLAIDREAISKTIFSGSRVPADDYINPVVPGHRPGACADCRYDPARAKQLFAQAGGISGNKLEIGYNADGGHKEWITAVANQVQQTLGITVTTRPFPQFANILDALGHQKYDGAFRMAWIMDYPSAEDYLKPIFGTDAIENGSNYGGYSNKKVDDLIANGDTAPTADAGVRFYQQADDAILKDLPYIPVYFYRTNGGYSKDVRNVKIDAFDRIDLYHAQKGAE